MIFDETPTKLWIIPPKQFVAYDAKRLRNQKLTMLKSRQLTKPHIEYRCVNKETLKRNQVKL
jgi:hypothetical protein